MIFQLVIESGLEPWFLSFLSFFLSLGFLTPNCIDPSHRQNIFSCSLLLPQGHCMLSRGHWNTGISSGDPFHFHKIIGTAHIPDQALKSIMDLNRWCQSNARIPTTALTSSPLAPLWTTPLMGSALPHKGYSFGCPLICTIGTVLERETWGIWTR